VKVKNNREDSHWSIFPLSSYALAIAVIWTLCFAVSLLWNISNEYVQNRDLAIKEAYVNYNNDASIWKWVASHGGIYVPVDEITPPNQYLDHIEERDIRTPSGKTLTLMNPAYVMRQVMRGYSEEYEVKKRLTSLKTINPVNDPDGWERKALLDLNGGFEEAMDFVGDNGNPSLRLMRPAITEKKCLLCHGHQGYKVGDVRGGISITLPLGSFVSHARKHIGAMVLSHALIWVLGLTGVFWGAHRIRSNIVRLDLAEEALREGEERFRELSEMLPETVFETDRNGAFTFANQKAFEVTGYSHDEIYGGKYAFDILEFEDMDKTGEKIRKLLDGEDTISGECNVVKKNGGIFPAIINAAPIIRDGRPVGARGILVDITQLKRAEGEIRNREEQVSLLLKSTAEGIYGIDTNGRCTFCNPSCLRLLGYVSEDELKGRNMHNLIHHSREDGSEYPKEECRIYEGFIKGQGIHVDDEVMWRSNGSSFYVEYWSYPITVGNDILGAVVTFIDITGRREAEEKIRMLNVNLERKVRERTSELDRSLKDTAQARDRIDGILKSVADGLIVTDEYNNVILMNRAAEDLLVIRFSEVIDQSIDHIIASHKLSHCVKAATEEGCLKQGSRADFILTDHVSGNLRVINARSSAIRDREDGVSGVVTILHDVTHEREVDRMKTEFVSTAAHELRTPLASIQGFSEILLTRNGLEAGEKKKFLKYINEESMVLGNIVGDLLDISRIESGHGFVLNRVPCKAGDAIREIVPYFMERTNKHTFDLVLPDEPVELNVDKEKMGQVLKNIIGNAVKYSPDGGVIGISGRISNGYFQVTVSDNGIGMTAEHMEKMFDKFYRAAVSISTIGGTGLGMTISKYIVEAHGGDISVESKYGEGTRVTFTVPKDL
jgi:PAS domain S-box-containing protein